jgi:hypothetical protein
MTHAKCKLIALELNENEFNEMKLYRFCMEANKGCDQMLWQRGYIILQLLPSVGYAERHIGWRGRKTLSLSRSSSENESGERVVAERVTRLQGR